MKILFSDGDLLALLDALGKSHAVFSVQLLVGIKHLLGLSIGKNNPHHLCRGNSSLLWHLFSVRDAIRPPANTRLTESLNSPRIRLPLLPPFQW